MIIDENLKKIDDKIDFNADEVLNINGFILTPTFVDPHLHIEKAFSVINKFSKEKPLKNQ